MLLLLLIELENVNDKDMVHISQNPERPRFHRWHLNHWPDVMACDCKWEKTKTSRLTKQEADESSEDEKDTE